VRGYRVETGEVEAALAAYPEALAAVVTAAVDPGGDTRLVAYVLPRNAGSWDDAGLLAFLGARLSAVMLPSAVVPLAALPLTAHGKIDRAALPAPASFASARRQPYVAPRGALEATLAEIWRELLQVERVGVFDSFFELGGHSLQVLRLLARVQEWFGVEVPLGRLAGAPTVAGLAVAIATELAAAADQDLLAETLAELRGGAEPALVRPASGGGAL
jgi:acyl carrier protein